VVGEAGSAAEALDLIALLAPDLVIADMEMTDENGLDMMAHIRREFPASQAILVSGDAEPQYQRLARQAGALAFITKAALSLDALPEALQGEA
jgi:DNA-binding NarL/FixJ family response regulator